jgi:hypothetical protein
MMQGGNEMPRTIPKDANLKPLVVRLPTAWHAAIQRQATKTNRNLQGQMIEIVEYYLRESNEFPDKDILLALKNEATTFPSGEVPCSTMPLADVPAPGSRVLVVPGGEEAQ